MINKKELITYLCDYYHHFNGFPMEYEDIDGVVYLYDTFFNILTKKDLYIIKKGK